MSVLTRPIKEFVGDGSDTVVETVALDGLTGVWVSTFIWDRPNGSERGIFGMGTLTDADPGISVLFGWDGNSIEIREDDSDSYGEVKYSQPSMHRWHHLMFHIVLVTGVTLYMDNALQTPLGVSWGGGDGDGLFGSSNTFKIGDSTLTGFVRPHAGKYAMLGVWDGAENITLTKITDLSRALKPSEVHSSNLLLEKVNW